MKKKKICSRVVLCFVCFTYLFGYVGMNVVSTSAESQVSVNTSQSLEDSLTTEFPNTQAPAADGETAESSEVTEETSSEMSSESAIAETTADTESQPEMKARRIDPSTFADEYTEVATNAAFEQALSAKKPKIRITAPLTFDRDFAIAYDVVIDFQNLAHDFQQRHIHLSEKPRNVEFQNFKGTGSHPGQLLPLPNGNQDENALIFGYSVDWLGGRYYFTGTLRFTGTFNIFNASKLSTMYVPKATVILDGVSGNIDMKPLETGLDADPRKCYFARAYRLEIINGTHLTAPYLSKFYGRLTATAESDAANAHPGVFISGGSKIMITYDRQDSVSDEGEAIDTLPDNVVLQVTDPGSELSVTTKIDINTDNNRGIIQMRGAGSKVNVSNGGKITVDTKTTSAFRMQGQNSQIDVESGGNINVVMEHDKDIPGNNGMRFVGSGLALVVDGAGSAINIKKNSGKSPAVRFENGNQNLKVLNGGSLTIHNVGDGHEYANRVSQGNQAILFDDTTGWFDSPEPAYFTVSGEKSNIDIRADSGAAVDTTGSLDLNFSAGEKTYLVMIGKTGQDLTGIISGNKLTVNIASPTYFDFQNRRVGSASKGYGGWIFQGNGASTLSIKQSEIALWRKSEAIFHNFDQDPYYFSDITDLDISGTDLGNYNSSTSIALGAEFAATGAGMKSYNRISANNQVPVVDDLRVPTNADKKIYGHVSVPEGVNAQLRDAWTDEVEVTLQVTYADPNKSSIQTKVQTVGQTDASDGLDPWGEGRRGGLFEVKLPDDLFLSPGDTVQVLSAKKVRGGQVVTELPEPKTTVDIIPPEPAILKDAKVYTDTKTISGTGEPGADVMLINNGSKVLTTSVVDDQGKFTLTIPENSLAVNDKLGIFLRDQAGDASRLGVVNKPITNDGVGNFNPPDEALHYHDAVFLPATVVIVDGKLSFEAPTKIDFGAVKATGLRAEAHGQAQGPLLIYDQRNTKQEWCLKVKETTPLTIQDMNGSSRKLEGVLYFAAKDNDYQVMSAEAQTVATGTASNSDPVDLSTLLTGQKGFKVVLPGNKQIPGEYKAEITWILEDAPQK
jgi:hypothetical protein